MFDAILCVFCALVSKVLCKMNLLILGSAVPLIASGVGPISPMEIGKANFITYIKNPLILKPLTLRQHFILILAVVYDLTGWEELRIAGFKCRGQATVLKAQKLKSTSNVGRGSFLRDQLQHML